MDDAPATPSDPTGDAHPAPLAVASYADRGEAEVAVAHLASAGIEARILDDVEGRVLPVDGEPGVVVFVRAADAETAAAILRS